MKPPSTVKVGPHTYRLERNDALLDAAGNLGDTNENTLLIRYQGNTAPTQLRSTIIHELLHACCLTAGIALSDRLTQEQLITRTEHLWLGVLRDNPALLAWLTT